ncbi:MAG: hypothetical protein RDU89_09825 [bacterium]|nr:hypothetical protein [bacterium]
MYEEERTYGFQRDFGAREMLEDARRDKLHSSQVYSRCAAESRHPDLHRLFMIAHENEQAQLREIGSYLEGLGSPLRPPAGAPECDRGRPGLRPRPGFYGPPGYPQQGPQIPGGPGNLPGAGTTYPTESLGIDDRPATGGEVQARPAGETGSEWAPGLEEERND